MAKRTTKRASIIKLPDGQYTQTGKEILKEFRVHFPGSKLADDSNGGQGQQNLEICRHILDRGDWNLAKHVINQSKMRWTLGTFKPFKSVGTHGTVPALLQQGMEQLVPHLCRIFRACKAYGFIPTVRKQVRVTHIPKPGKLDYTTAEAYRPISLLSFLLKMIEKLVDRNIREGALKKYPLYRNQHAYQIDKSTENHFIMW
jgi:hypothetical protein